MNKRQLNAVLVPGNPEDLPMLRLSKVLSKKISDVHGFIDDFSYGDGLVFVVSHIVFADGTTVHVVTDRTDFDVDVPVIKDDKKRSLFGDVLEEIDAALNPDVCDEGHVNCS
jgi:hypothetical protein